MSISKRNETELQFLTLPPAKVNPSDIKANGKLLSDADIELVKQRIEEIDREREKQAQALGKTYDKRGAEYPIQLLFPDKNPPSQFNIFAIKKENEVELFAGYEVLGQGNFGLVRLAQNLRNAEWVALKEKSSGAETAEEKGKRPEKQGEEKEVEIEPVYGTSVINIEPVASMVFDIRSELPDEDQISHLNEPTYLLVHHDNRWTINFYGQGIIISSDLDPSIINHLQEKLNELAQASKTKPADLSMEDKEALKQLIKQYHDTKSQPYSPITKKTTETALVTGEYKILEALNKGKGKFKQEYLSDEGKMNKKVLIVELEKSMTLSDYIEAKKLSKDLTPQMAIRITNNIFNNFEEFKDKGILHRDIKPENIMIDPVTLKTTFIDFGTSIQLKGSEEYSHLEGARGTLQYAHPNIAAEIEKLIALCSCFEWQYRNY